MPPQNFLAAAFVSTFNALILRDARLFSAERSRLGRFKHVITRQNHKVFSHVSTAALIAPTERTDKKEINETKYKETNGPHK